MSRNLPPPRDPADDASRVMIICRFMLMLSAAVLAARQSFVLPRA